MLTERKLLKENVKLFAININVSFSLTTQGLLNAFRHNWMLVFTSHHEFFVKNL
jgi:hypothetical protein